MPYVASRWMDSMVNVIHRGGITPCWRTERQGLTKDLFIVLDFIRLKGAPRVHPQEEEEEVKKRKKKKKNVEQKLTSFVTVSQTRVPKCFE